MREFRSFFTRKVAAEYLTKSPDQAASVGKGLQEKGYGWSWLERKDGGTLHCTIFHLHVQTIGITRQDVCKYAVSWLFQPNHDFMVWFHRSNLQTVCETVCEHQPLDLSVWFSSYLIIFKMYSIQMWINQYLGVCLFFSMLLMETERHNFIVGLGSFVYELHHQSFFLAFCLITWEKSYMKKDTTHALYKVLNNLIIEM